MLRLVFANGEHTKIEETSEEFIGLITAAAPSSWVSVTMENIGPVMLNSFIVAYYYED